MEAQALQDMLAFATEIAKRAGEVILEEFRKADKQVTKKSDRDFVTATDQRCETLIMQMLRERYPNHLFIGEEETAKNESLPELTDAPTWFCDPLDGTTNFVHTLPTVCVCIGLTIQKEVVLGVVHVPIMDETFAAAKGMGATVNDQPIATTGQTDPSASLVVTELGPDRSRSTLDTWMARFRATAERVRSIRCLGSCAYGMTNVACGRSDAFYEIGFGGPWDCAAAAIIVQEAGGHVLDPSGGPFRLMSRRVACAASTALAEQLTQALHPYSSNPSEPL